MAPAEDTVARTVIVGLSEREKVSAQLVVREDLAVDDGFDFARKDVGKDGMEEGDVRTEE